MKDAIEKCKQLAEEYPIGTEVWFEGGGQVAYTVFGCRAIKDPQDEYLELDLWSLEQGFHVSRKSTEVSKTPLKKPLPEGWYAQYSLFMENRKLYLLAEGEWTYLGESEDSPVYCGSTPCSKKRLFWLSPDDPIKIDPDEYDLGGLDE